MGIDFALCGKLQTHMELYNYKSFAFEVPSEIHAWNTVGFVVRQTLHLQVFVFEV